MHTITEVTKLFCCVSGGLTILGSQSFFCGVQIPVLTQIYRFFNANLNNNFMIYSHTGYKIDNSKSLILLNVHLRDCYRR
jgi:hypothetical protein